MGETHSELIVINRIDEAGLQQVVELVLHHHGILGVESVLLLAD